MKDLIAQLFGITNAWKAENATLKNDNANLEAEVAALKKDNERVIALETELNALKDENAAIAADIETFIANISK